MFESELEGKLIVAGLTRSIDVMDCECCGKKTHQLASVLAKRSDNGEYEEAEVCDSCLLSLVFPQKSRDDRYWKLIESMKKNQKDRVCKQIHVIKQLHPLSGNNIAKEISWAQPSRSFIRVRVRLGCTGAAAFCRNSHLSMAHAKKNMDVSESDDLSSESEGTSVATTVARTVSDVASVSKSRAKESSLPVWKQKIDRVQGAIWKYVQGDGKVRFTFSPSRSYKDEKKGWTNLYFFDQQDMHALELVSKEAREYIQSQGGVTSQPHSV